MSLNLTDREIQKQELIRKQKQIELDLKAAASIQRTLLPSQLPDFHQVDAAWEFLPCATIGGDIFNLLPLGGGRMGCYMMDVSGHGVHSALVTVSVSQLLQPGSSTLPLDSPAAVCEELDRRFPLERFNTFFSMIYIVFDLEAGTLCWCNAGHPPAVLLRTRGELELLDAGSPIIGLGGILPFTENKKQVNAGDRIFLCTDGLIERRNQNGDLFGVEGFLAGIGKAGSEPLATSVSLLVRAAMDFGEGIAVADDISLLGLEIK
ncbi:MAG: PP2C family protein-serine/threonine phosphatase [Syntrophobacteraceae bacterium]